MYIGMQHLEVSRDYTYIDPFLNDLSIPQSRITEALFSPPLQMKANTATKREFPAGQPYKYCLRYGAVAQLRERHLISNPWGGTYQVPVTAAACTAACTAAFRGTRDFVEQTTA